MPLPDPVRVLVAVVSSAQPLIQRLMSECPLDFASSFEHGEQLVQENRYSDILIGHLFAESRMFEFAMVVRDGQPWARVVCVKGAGPALSAERRSAIDLAVKEIGCEGFVDLTSQELPGDHISLINDILRECRRTGQPL